MKIFDTLKNIFGAEIGSTVVNWIPKLFTALIILLIGLWIIRMVMKAIGRVMDSKHIDATLKPFLLTLQWFVIKSSSNCPISNELC